MGIINIIGEPIDELGPIETQKFYPIHRPAPAFTEMNTTAEQLLTGIKVVDLLASTQLWILLTPHLVCWILLSLVSVIMMLHVVFRRSCRTTSLFRISLQFLEWMSLVRRTN